MDEGIAPKEAKERSHVKHQKKKKNEKRANRLLLVNQDTYGKRRRVQVQFIHESVPQRESRGLARQIKE